MLFKMTRLEKLYLNLNNNIIKDIGAYVLEKNIIKLKLLMTLDLNLKSNFINITIY